MNKHSLASVRHISPKGFAKVAEWERRINHTIKRKGSYDEHADQGTIYPEALNPDLIRQLNDRSWDGPIFSDSIETWIPPVSMSIENDGPS